jgi:hypothetical protein
MYFNIQNVGLKIQITRMTLVICIFRPTFWMLKYTKKVFLLLPYTNCYPGRPSFLLHRNIVI